MLFILKKFFLPVICPSLAISFVKESLLMVLPLYVIHIGGSLADGAMIIAFKGIGMMAASLPAGFLLSKVGDKSVMIGAVLIFIASLVLITVSPSPTILMVSATAIGFAHSSLLVGRIAYLTEASKVQERGRVMALTAGTNRISNVIGPLASGLIITAMGFTAVFYTYIGISIVAIFFIIQYVPFSLPVVNKDKYFHALKKVCRSNSHTFKTAGVAAFALMLVRSSRALLLPLMGGALLLNESDIGLAIAIGALIDTLLFYPAGSLMDKVGRKPIFIVSLTVIGLGLCLLPFTQGLLGLILVASLMGIGNGVSTGIIVTVGADLAPQHDRANFIGIWRLFSDVGSTGGPILIGGLLTFSSLAVGAYTTGLIGLIGGVFVLLKVKESYAIKSSNLKHNDEKPLN